MVVTYLENFLPIKSRGLTRSQDLHYHNVTKPGRMFTYHGGLFPIKLHGLLVRWSSEITWLVKNIVSPLPEWPSSTNLTGC